MERNRGQLQRLGVITTDEVLLLAIVLSKVPPKYEQLVDLMTLDDEDLTYERLKSRMRLVHQRAVASNPAKSDKGTAFTATQFKRSWAPLNVCG